MNTLQNDSVRTHQPQMVTEWFREPETPCSHTDRPAALNPTEDVWEELEETLHSRPTSHHQHKILENNDCNSGRNETLHELFKMMSLIGFGSFEAVKAFLKVHFQAEFL